MSRFFFQMIDGEVLPDLEGTELPDLATARHAAIDIASERLKGSGEEFWQGKHWRIEISDETGAVLAALTITTDTASLQTSTTPDQTVQERPERPSS